MAEMKVTSMWIRIFIFIFECSCGGLQEDMEDIVKAFITLGATKPKNSFTVDRFHEILTSLGDVMDDEELTEALQFLTGKETIEKALPESITPKVLATDILGFEAPA
jgi:hypothetical protein